MNINIFLSNNNIFLLPNMKIYVIMPLSSIRIFTTCKYPDIKQGVMMNWTQNKSIVLSKICVFIFAILGILLNIYIHHDIKFIILRRVYIPFPREELLRQYIIFTLIAVYIMDVLAYTALLLLYRLLCNIHKSKVFTLENVKYLRLLSWCCFIASFVCFILTFCYLPFVLLVTSTAFMALILRVVKNVFTEAIEIKQENEYTI